ncbi:Sedoheptulose-bisphosphatase [Tribonema minus]|uniref:Sedoheptulose-bisphosphatase n=1 Tax=Tribonema minus TaxID=303371 RepID=A0A835YXX8_9STRA|nr:Sedoheptulose-bisphosphatase [Tribonema minus]
MTAAAVATSPTDWLDTILKDYAPDIDPKLVKTLSAIATACEGISRHLWTADGEAKAGSSNAYGDDQLDIDLYADHIIFEEMKASKCVAVAASEEKPQELEMGGEGYSVAFDPLDGSSIIDANFAVGSIFGVWHGRGLQGRTGREQAASCMAVYGPRTHLALALAGSVTRGAPVAMDLLLHPEKRLWTVSKAKLTIAPAGKVFAPGNLRATSDHPQYKALFDHWVGQRYTLRYTGGMVPDVYYSLVKGKGVFANVPSPSAPAKLRLLYECAPIALLVEAAGGRSVVAPAPGAAAAAAAAGGGGAAAPQSVLDVVADGMDVRLGVCYGGVDEVATFNRFMFAS